MAIALIVFGVVVAACGLALYALILLTNLHLRFLKTLLQHVRRQTVGGEPDRRAARADGFALIMAPTMLTVLRPVLPDSFLWLGAFFIPFLLAQLLLIWLTMLAPLETGVIAKRLAAKGVGPDLLARGHFVGVSDPSQGRLKKVTLVEEESCSGSSRTRCSTSATRSIGTFRASRCSKYSGRRALNALGDRLQSWKVSNLPSLSTTPPEAPVESPT